MPASASISPFQAAVKRLTERTPVASQLSSAEWEAIPTELRNKAIFSARVANIRLITAMQARLKKASSLSGDTFTSKSAFVAELRQLIGAQPGDTGKLTDIESTRRLGLVYDFNLEEAYSYGRYKAGNSQALLDAFPCQELVRVESRQQERDWKTRWVQAGGKLYANRMIATKTSTVWSQISRFNNPWPPFDFGSGMGVEDISRQEAISLGVITPAQRIQPEKAQAFDQAEITVTPEESAYLQQVFGDQIVIKSGKARWKGAA
jgi:hypothetical protein